ncbi:MAG: zinc ribbon domain-containing protein [Verrucomicrobia bacterium]|nr:zinc ribbon domain-containing protein [Verrucomicrobiota bacterium]MBU1909120.1 zinc ribbon domain-containing protein [Verrucomicrobiota bacterium]
MTLKNLCPQCGIPNEPTRLFCGTCGARLNLGGRRWSVSASGGRWLLRIVEILLLVAMGLLLWPARPGGAPGGEAEAREFIGKMRILATAAERGGLIAEIVSEAEINAYLAELLKRTPALSRSEGMSQLGIGEVNFRFQPDSITVTVVALWGPVRLSYEVSGRPVWPEGRFGFDVRSARWGHLPLVGPAAHWMIRRLEVMFSGMERERNILDHIQRLDMGQGRVRVATGL